MKQGEGLLIFISSVSFYVLIHSSTVYNETRGGVIDIHFFCGFYVLIHSSTVYNETRGGVIDIHFFCGFYVLLYSSTCTVYTETRLTIKHVSHTLLAPKSVQMADY